jgi:phage major head subunit gpT-like protein
MATFTSTLPEILEPWVKKIFIKEYNMIEVLYTQVFNVVGSTKAFEDTFQVAALGTFILKPEGAPISYDDPVQSLRKRVVHQTFALGFRVTMEAMEDDQHRIISKMPADLADSARDHKENLAWGLFNDAFAGLTFTGMPEGDNIRRSLCNTGHIRLKDGGTSSNQLSPGVALSVSGIEAAVTNFRLTLSEEGRQINITPRVLVTHPNEEFNAAQLLQSDKEPFTDENQINTVSTNRLGLGVIHVPYLTDTDAWWLMSSKNQHSVVWYNRKGMTFERNKDAQTKDSLWDAHYRASVTFDDWRGVVGSQP